VKPAFIYARVSTADKEQNPEVQLRELREWCQYKKVPFAPLMSSAAIRKRQRSCARAVVKNTTARVDSMIEAVSGKRLTYAGLTA
jgi:hypothetical protein